MRAGVALQAALLAAWTAAGAPAWSEGDAGAYLSARSASSASDYEAAARFASIAFASDRANDTLADEALGALLALGDIARAEPIARQKGGAVGLSALVLDAAAAGRGDWQTLLEMQDAGERGGALADDLIRAWALVGLGRMSEALALFDAAAAVPGQRNFGLYHKALALGVHGDIAAAEALFSLPPAEGLAPTRRSTIAHATMLGQLGRAAEGAALVRSRFGTSPDAALADLLARLDSNGPLPPLVADARQGVAELFFGLAAAAGDGRALDFRAMIYARAALWLQPALMEAILIAAPYYEAVGRADLAIRAYEMIPAGHPSWLTAELGRASVLRRSGQSERAAEVLLGLARQYPDMADIRASLGDALRSLGRFDEADEAYSLAIGAYPENEPSLWLVHYTRGIARQALDDWPGAEADYRRALALNPGQPRVLNHLGYSLVERGEQLDEALGLVTRAAAAEPQNGAIVDSLGWALFRLGRAEEAVEHLERAAELEAVDPVVNDHLGDAYWMAGRQTEARFQWRRALSFGPAPEEAERIRQKLQFGLEPAASDAAALAIGVRRDGG